MRQLYRAGSVLMKYIDEKVSELDAEWKALQEEIVTANVTDTKDRLKQLTNHVKTWETLSFEDRQAVVDTLIKVIRKIRCLNYECGRRTFDIDITRFKIIVELKCPHCGEVVRVYWNPKEKKKYENS